MAKRPRKGTGKKGASSADASPCRFRLVGEARAALNNLGNKVPPDLGDPVREAVLHEAHKVIERLPTLALVAMLPVLCKHAEYMSNVPPAPSEGGA
ncbi:MAG TPA: hypothetical protein VM243_05730 [Phycisphaerae bacterium]|nr:hypothetical protein [Phycisphaerae bacterium]